MTAGARAVPVGRARVVAPGTVSVTPVRGMPTVLPGADVAALVDAALTSAGLTLEPWDVVVVTHKVISKSEGAIVDLTTVEPTDAARALVAAGNSTDPRVLEVVLRQSTRVVRAEGQVLVCETHHGLVCANAGVDQSNAPGRDLVCLLPADPDASARRLRAVWLARTGGGPLGVIISDTFGRPFRLGGVNVAIGVAGMPAMTDWIGAADSVGYALQGSEIASADEIAAAAELVMGKLEAIPVAVVRGLRWEGPDQRAGVLQRPAAEDLFRRATAAL